MLQHTHGHNNCILSVTFSRYTWFYPFSFFIFILSEQLWAYIYIYIYVYMYMYACICICIISWLMIGFKKLLFFQLFNCQVLPEVSLSDILISQSHSKLFLNQSITTLVSIIITTVNRLLNCGFLGNIF